MASQRYPQMVLLLALVLGICADLLFYGRWLGLSVALFVALGLAAIAWLSWYTQRPPVQSNLWLGAAALFFAICVMVRATPLLLFFNLCACIGLLLLFVASYRSNALHRLPGWSYVSTSFLALMELSIRPAPLMLQGVSTIPLGSTQVRRFMPVGRGLLIALPVVAGFTGLLMAADSVFASYVGQLSSLRLPFDLATVLPHMLFVSAVTWICAGGMQVALYSEVHSSDIERHTDLPAEGDTQRLRLPRTWQWLGCVESLTVLIAVNLLFGSFMLIQGAYFFGGMDTLDRSGLTYAEYARRGFFELLTVACLSLGLIWTLALLTRRDQPWQRLAFNSTSTVLILLVLGLLSSAFLRMRLYEQAYGYTHLRLYTYAFMIWLALVLLLFLAALLREKPRLFTFGSFASALCALALLNIANPDVMIVQENIARYQTSGKLDIDYLTTLSADATPALVARLDLLDSKARTTLIEALAVQQIQLAEADAQSGWPGWHLARANAQAAIATIAEQTNP